MSFIKESQSRQISTNIVVLSENGRALVCNNCWSLDDGCSSSCTTNFCCVNPNPKNKTCGYGRQKIAPKKPSSSRPSIEVTDLKPSSSRPSIEVTDLKPSSSRPSIEVTDLKPLLSFDDEHTTHAGSKIVDVQDLSGRLTRFRMPNDMDLGVLFDAYVIKRGLIIPTSDIMFLLDGIELKSNHLLLGSPNSNVLAFPRASFNVAFIDGRQNRECSSGYESRFSGYIFSRKCAVENDSKSAATDAFCSGEDYKAQMKSFHVDCRLIKASLQASPLRSLPDDCLRNTFADMEKTLKLQEELQKSLDLSIKTTKDMMRNVAMEYSHLSSAVKSVIVSSQSLQEASGGSASSSSSSITSKFKVGDRVTLSKSYYDKMHRIYCGRLGRLGESTNNRVGRVHSINSVEMFGLAPGAVICVVFEDSQFMHDAADLTLATDLTLEAISPPTPKEIIENITIKVTDSTGDYMMFRVKKTTKMQKIFTAYAQRRRVETSSLRFLFDGEILQPDETPLSLDLEDEDQIDVMTATSSSRLEHIKVKVKDNTGDEMQFLVFKTTKMQKIFDAYAQRKGIANSSVRFEFLGETLQLDQTPLSLNLKEDDHIDVKLIANWSLFDGENSSSPSSLPLSSSAPSPSSSDEKKEHNALENTANKIKDFVEAVGEIGSGGNSKNAGESDKLPHLSKTFYSYSPALSVTADNLKAVNGFSVECSLHGRVDWLGEVDVRGIDLDDVVSFDSHAQLSILPHPQFSHALNRPAIVTLYNMHVDPNKANDRRAEYRELCLLSNFEFIEFDADLGNLTFKVESFY